MVVEILFFGPPVSKLNSTVASAPELGKTKSTEFPLENNFDEVPPHNCNHQLNRNQYYIGLLNFFDKFFLFLISK